MPRKPLKCQSPLTSPSDTGTAAQGSAGRAEATPAERLGLVLVPPIPVSHWDVGAAGAGGWAGMGTRTSRDGEGCPEHRNPLGFGVGVFLLSALLYPINLQNGKRKKKSSLAGKPRGKDPERARNSPSLPFYVPRDDWVAAAFNFCSAPAPCSSHSLPVSLLLHLLSAGASVDAALFFNPARQPAFRKSFERAASACAKNVWE